MDTTIPEKLWNEIILVSGQERADLCIDASWHEYEESNYDIAKVLAETALDIYEELGPRVDYQKVIAVFVGITHCLLELERYREAADLFIVAGSFARNFDEGEYVASMWRAIDSYINSRDFSLALSISIQVLEDPLLVIEDEQYVKLLFWVAECSQELGMFEFAIPYLERALSIAHTLEKPGQAAWIHDELATCYIQLRHPTKAIHYARLSLDYAILKNDPNRLSYAHWSMGKAKYLLGDFNLARSHLNRCKELLQQAPGLKLKWTLEIEAYLANIYEKEGKTRECEIIRARILGLTTEHEVVRK